MHVQANFFSPSFPRPPVEHYNLPSESPAAWPPLRPSVSPAARGEGTATLHTLLPAPFHSKLDMILVEWGCSYAIWGYFSQRKDKNTKENSFTTHILLLSYLTTFFGEMKRFCYKWSEIRLKNRRNSCDRRREKVCLVQLFIPNDISEQRDSSLI